jgi:hypothetical protein
MTVYSSGNGVSYTLTLTNFGLTYDLLIKHVDGTTSSISGIPSANVLTSDGGTLTIASIAGGSTYVIPPGVTGSVTIAASLLGSNNVYVGGTATISSTISALSSLTVEVDGGSVTATSGVVLGALSGMTVNLEDGGTFGNGGAVIGALQGTTINFGDGGGTFVANAGGALIDLSTVTIKGFDAAVDKIEFAGLAAPIDHYTIATSGGSQIITLYSGTGTELGSVEVAGTSLAVGQTELGQSGPLTVSESGSGSNYTITIDPVAAVLCFLAGTHVVTPNGSAAVERLKAGDLVLTADGRSLPVRWVGRNTVSTLFADSLRVMPVRIRAGALAENMPVRDLLVSPDHAMFIDGVLIQAGALVNGVSVIRESNMPKTFVYYHVEVDGHALILAEGAVTETFVDNVSRMAFDNWAEHVSIFGAGGEVPEMDYPRAKSARQVPKRVREMLAARQEGFREAAIAA